MQLLHLEIKASSWTVKYKFGKALKKTKGDNKDKLENKLSSKSAES